MDTWKEIQSDLEVLCSKESGMNALNDIFIQNEAREGYFKSSLPLASGTIFVDLVKEETVWSKGIYELLGFEPKSIDPTPEVFLSHVLEEDRPTVEARMKDALSGKKKEDYISYRTRSEQGKIQKVLALPHLILDVDDKPICLHVSIHNLSDIPQASGNPDSNLELSAYRLQKSTRWLSKIFENSAFGIFIFDSTGQILQSNEMFSKITGYNQEELNNGVKAFDIVSKDHLDWVMEKSMSLLSKKEEKVNYEFPIITKSGFLKQVEGYTTMLDHEEGLLLCFVSDIEEKKQTLEALKSSESRLSEAQKMAKMGSWGLDFGTGRIEWSAGMYNIMEIAHDVVPNKELILSIIHPEDKDLFVETFFEGFKEVSGLEIRHITKSGVKHLLVNSKLDLKDGKPVQYHGIVQDVSESRFHQKRLQVVQETAKLGWWEANLITGEDVWSDSMYEILCLDKNTTKPCFESYLKTAHPDDQRKMLSAMDDPEILKNGWYNEEFRHKGADGTYKYFVSSGQFVCDGDRPVKLIGTMVDISETKEMQLRLAETQEITRMGWWEINLLTYETKWSDTTFDIIGVDKSNGPLSFEELVERVHPDDRAWLTQDPNNLKDGWSNKELRYKRASGGFTYVLTSGQVIFVGDVPVKMVGTNMDITALKETRDKLEQAQKIGKLGWWETNVHTGVTQFSNSIYDMMDIEPPKEGLTVEAYLALLHPDDASKLAKDIEKETMNVGWVNRELRYKQQDGSYRYILSSGQTIYHDGQAVNMLGTNLDITSTKEAQLRLQEAQKIAKLGWWEFDLTGKGDNRYSDEYMSIMEILDVAEIKIFQDFLDLIHPDDRQAVLDCHADMEKNMGWSNLVTRVRRKKGGYKYVSSNANVEFFERKPVRLLGSLLDITELKEIEIELEKSEINLKALITSTENLVFVIDDQLIFREVFCNDRTKIHYEPDYFIGKGLREVWNEKLPHGVELAKMCEHSLKKGREHSMTFQFAPKGGKSYWWEATVHPFKGQDEKQRLAVFVNDISTKKYAEEELLKGMQKEKELNEMSTQFVSMASHQFRTPLTVIKSNMQLLELSGIDHPIIKKVSGRLTTEVDRLVNLMEDMLAMGKVQSGSIKPNLKKTDMVSLVNKLKLNIERVQDDGRTLQITIKGTKRQVSIDTQFMEHALNNLIDNAFKYSKGSRDPEIEITYASKKVHIKVSDYGLGIPDTDRSRLFGSFQRGSNVQHISGTGLGLAVTKEFISLNRGTIFLDNDKDKTTFCIDLPLN